MNRVLLSGRLAGRPIATTINGVAVTVLRLLVPRGPQDACCPESVIGVECVTYRGLAGYLATFGEAGCWLTVDGRLYQNTASDDESASKRLCVHVDHAEFVTPIPLPTGLPNNLPHCRGCPLGPPKPPASGTEGAR